MTILLQNIKARREHDNYPTPAHIAKWVVEKCFKLVAPSTTYFFLEPGCGDRAPFAKVASELSDRPLLIDIMDLRPVVSNEIYYNMVGSEIDYLNEQQDWRSDKYKYDVIATNPPFKVALQFWKRSMQLLNHGGVLGLVVKLSFLASKKRAETWRSNPPAEVHVFYPRPSFSGDGGTDIAQEYCAAFWYRPEMARIICRSPLTTMSWVNLKEVEGNKNV